MGRYQQPSVRAEWAYNLCAGAEQMLDEPQVRLFWGALHGQLSEDVYWGLRAQWQLLREQVFRHSKDGEVPTIMNPWTGKELVVQHLRGAGEERCDRARRFCGSFELPAATRRSKALASIGDERVETGAGGASAHRVTYIY